MFLEHRVDGDVILRKYLTIIWCLLISCFANLSVISAAYSIQLTAATTISPTNTSFDGQDLIVNGTILTINGSHQFNSVQLINGAILTHSPSPTTKLELTSQTFFIDASSSINLAAKGRLPTANVTGASGGSYGGRGGIYDSSGSTNPVFGNNKLPTDLGIGGIGSAGKTHGGGAIKLIADLLILDGKIIAEGEGFNTFFTSQGGGSGGSIFLDVGTLNGSGTIQASGGSGYTFYGGGGGGGGRIAVYYQSTNFDLQNNIINEGGVFKPLFGEVGQSGSIYTEDTTAVNQAPTVNAGPSLAVNEQSPVTLSGSAVDTDGVITSYAWTQLSGPTISIINANTATASFTAPTVLSVDSPTVLSFRLTVTDDDGATATSDTTIGVMAVNALPVASAGTDISVNKNTDVSLSGSGDDSDGFITGYQWTQITGTAVTLNNSNSATTSFTSPAISSVEQLTFRLTVTDNESGSHSDDVSVTVNPVNTLPVANITAIDPVAENTTTSLDGSASNDADGTIVSYNWTQVAGPAVTLSNADSAVLTFTAPAVYQDTVLSFRLNVVDNNAGTASATTQVTVFSVNPDDDVDGLPDIWEIEFFTTLDHDGTTDSDNDGATDLQEYNFATDPTVEQQPGQPVIVSPDDIEVASLQPELTLANPDQHTGFTVSYEFEVYRDTSMTELISFISGANLNWTINTALTDNSSYYWRARAVGATLFSEWVSSKFFVNTENDAPGAFNVSYPQDNVWVASFTPTLSVTNSVDIDQDDISYRFEVYADADLIASAENILPGSDGTTSWTVDIPLQENTWYLWRATASDEHGLSTVSSSEPQIFINTLNDAPLSPTLNTPFDGEEITSLTADLFVNNSTDPENEAIQYSFELDTMNTFDSINKQSSAAISETLNVTGWSVNNLIDNSWYYWRAKASDGFAESLWVNGQFFVNQFNDAPGVPEALNPGNQAWVGSLQPTLEVYPAIDIDGDNLNYEFEVYEIINNEYALFAAGGSDTPFWQLDVSLDESGYYYWHARAIDEHGLTGEWGKLMTFYADSDGINNSPVISLKRLKYENGEALAIHKAESRRNDKQSNRNEHSSIDDNEENYVEIKWNDYDPDSNARISLYYDTDVYGEDGILITQNMLEDPDGDFDQYKWDVSQMAPGIYFVYAIIDDGNSISVDYSNNPVIVGDGGGLPFIVFKSPEVENEGKRNQHAMIAWQDLDNNSNASISLYYDMDNIGFDGILITDTLKEDPDGKADRLLWDTSALTEGSYYIYATISDESSSYRVYAKQPFKIKQNNKNGNGRWGK